MKTAFTVLMLGLDGSGKSTLLHSMRNNKTDGMEILPTASYSIEMLSIPQLSKPILVIDASGQGRHRENWRTFYPDSDAIIFVVDSTDTKRLAILNKTIEEFLSDPCKYGSFYSDLLWYNIVIEKANIPIVFAMNKQDKQEAVDKEDLRDLIGFDKFKRYSKKKWHFKETSGYSGMGVGEAFDWISNNVSVHANNNFE